MCACKCVCACKCGRVCACVCACVYLCACVYDCVSVCVSMCRTCPKNFHGSSLRTSILSYLAPPKTTTRFASPSPLALALAFHASLPPPPPPPHPQYCPGPHPDYVPAHVSRGTWGRCKTPRHSLALVGEAWVRHTPYACLSFTRMSLGPAILTAWTSMFGTSLCPKPKVSFLRRKCTCSACTGECMAYLGIFFL